MVDKNVAAAAHTVGERLRQVRLQRQLRLSEIPALTRGEFNASAVSQYERGRRAPTVERLAALCSHYGIPLAEIVTGKQEHLPSPRTPIGGPSDPIDLQWLAAQGGPEAGALRRFGAFVADRRHCGDSNGQPMRALRIRTGDFEVLALSLGTAATLRAGPPSGELGHVEGFFARLRHVGLVVKQRRSERDGALTGYAVALPDRTDAAGGPVFYSGGKLAVLADAVGRMRSEQDRAVRQPPSGAPPNKSALSTPAGWPGRLAVRSGQPGQLRSTPVATRVRVPPSSRLAVPAEVCFFSSVST